MKHRQLRGKEQDQLQRLKQENAKLKQELTKLRKSSKDIDYENYERLKKIVKQQYKEELSFKKKEKTLEEKWQCYKCSEGIMKLIPLSRSDGDFYFRSCTHCTNRTKIKEYTEDVEGV